MFERKKLFSLPGVFRAAPGDGAPTDRALRDTGDGSILEWGDIIDRGEPAGCWEELK